MENKNIFKDKFGTTPISRDNTIINLNIGPSAQSAIHHLTRNQTTNSNGTCKVSNSFDLNLGPLQVKSKEEKSEYSVGEWQVESEQKDYKIRLK